MKVLKDIKELLQEELKEIKKKDSLTPNELESVHKAVETIKAIDEICAMNGEAEDEGYSGRGVGRVRMNGYSGTYMPLLDGPHYPVRYEGRNRYSSSGPYYHHDRLYARESATANMIDKLERMYDNATSESERAAIRDCIERLEY